MAVYHIGMDLHKRFSQLTETDKEGRVYRKFKLYNHPDLLKDYFSYFLRSIWTRRDKFPKRDRSSRNL
ncbi:MAG: hypothetical protein DRP68_06860 [Candidatus Omnitrophota bacterium]|nr:MAG: hypothetical protein DRP68_06860 [Candidatus Omnitrophota bacterium]